MVHVPTTYCTWEQLRLGKKRLTRSTMTSAQLLNVGVLEILTKLAEALVNINLYFKQYESLAYLPPPNHRQQLIVHGH
jgi:hypothetical protein